MPVSISAEPRSHAILASHQTRYSNIAFVSLMCAFLIVQPNLCNFSPSTYVDWSGLCGTRGCGCAYAAFVVLSLTRGSTERTGASRRSNIQGLLVRTRGGGRTCQLSTSEH